MPLETTQVPVPYGPYYGPLNDFSGTVTVGGTAQTPKVANPFRRYILIVNQSNTVLYVGFGFVPTGVPGALMGIPLKACSVAGDGSGGSIAFETNFVPTGFVSILGANTGQAYTILEG